jgi:hypothetical protein
MRIVPGGHANPAGWTCKLCLVDMRIVPGGHAAETQKGVGGGGDRGSGIACISMEQRQSVLVSMCVRAHMLVKAGAGGKGNRGGGNVWGVCFFESLREAFWYVCFPCNALAM